jgi:hypothetical protein
MAHTWHGMSSAEWARTATDRQLAETLTQDVRGRFELLGPNVAAVLREMARRMDARASTAAERDRLAGLLADAIGLLGRLDWQCDQADHSRVAWFLERARQAVDGQTETEGAKQ